VLDHNNDEIDRWRQQHKGLRWDGLDDQLASLWTGIHWVAIVNIDHLPEAATAVHRAFAELPKHFSRDRQLLALINARAKSQRRRLKKKGAV
jgi:hypothetical protein